MSFEASCAHTNTFLVALCINWHFSTIVVERSKRRGELVPKWMRCIDDREEIASQQSNREHCCVI